MFGSVPRFPALSPRGPSRTRPSPRRPSRTLSYPRRPFPQVHVELTVTRGVLSHHLWHMDCHHLWHTMCHHLWHMECRHFQHTVAVMLRA